MKVLQGRRFVCVGRGAYARRDGETTEETLIMGTSPTWPPQTLVTGVSGLRLQGVLMGSPDPLHFVATHPRQVRRRGVRVTRVATLPPHEGSIARTRRTLLGGCRQNLSLLDLVTAGDWLIRAKLTTLAGLKAYVDSSSTRGVGPARDAVALVRERVDSVRETWLRLCIVLVGLPAPQCNPTVSGVRGYGRVDLTYLEYRVLIEYEGDQHRGDKRQWNRDIDRYDDFAQAEVRGHPDHRRTGSVSAARGPPDLRSDRRRWLPGVLSRSSINGGWLLFD